MSAGSADTEANIDRLIEALRAKHDWTPAQTSGFMRELMAGRLPTDRVVEALELLRAKGESASEITEAARTLRAVGTRVETGCQDLLDTCGTGGDGSCTVNVSSLVALIAAAVGVKVAKHGNRAVSGVCGSADFLSAIGVPLEAPAEKLVRGLQETGFAFFYAPQFHPSIKHAAPARKAIVGRTLFNCLGPLANPAGAAHQLVGVYEARLVDLVAEALGNLGTRHAVVVFGEDGMDEVSPVTATQVAEWEKGRLRHYVFTPEEAGIQRVSRGSIRSDNAQAAVREGLAILDGASGPKTDLVVLNAGFALLAADRVATPAEGVVLAQKALSDGSVRKKTDQIREFYQK